VGGVLTVDEQQLTILRIAGGRSRHSHLMHVAQHRPAPRAEASPTVLINTASGQP
jgi:hypothetical protein